MSREQYFADQKSGRLLAAMLTFSAASAIELDEIIKIAYGYIAEQELASVIEV